jgi:nucleoside-diphosphate-sugar epimerase
MDKVIAPKLLVIGGSGFIGQHVVRLGVQRGWNVTCLGLNKIELKYQNPKVTYLRADLIKIESLKILSKMRYDYVVNLGGYINHTLFRDDGRRQINYHFDGLLNIIECINRPSLKRFVQVGSSDEYGGSSAPQNEELRENPISPYSLAKLAGTQFLQMLNRTENFPSVVIRIFLTYGPGQGQDRFIPQIIRGFLNNETISASRGEQLRDFCYVDDVVNAIYLLLECDSANGEVFNVGSGFPISVKNIIEMIKEIIGKGVVDYGKINYRPGENMALYADNKKIKQIVAWKPTVDLKTGLMRTIDWYDKLYINNTF